MTSLKEALELKKMVIEPNHPSIAVTIGNIAVMYCKLGQYSDALKSFNESLKLYKETHPSNHHLIALQVCNIASVCGKLGNDKTFTEISKVILIFMSLLCVY